MDLHGKKSLLRAFGYAIEGIREVTKNERNMRIHLGIAFLTIVGAFLLQFSLTHWLILLLVIAGIFSLEMVNSSVERVVDLVTKEYEPLAKRAKDAAAGAVFIYCIFAVIIGLLLFIPPFIKLLF